MNTLKTILAYLGLINVNYKDALEPDGYIIFKNYVFKNKKPDEVIIPINKFINYCNNGEIGDWMGKGFISNGEKRYNIKIKSSDIVDHGSVKKGEDAPIHTPKNVSHIIWRYKKVLMLGNKGIIL